MHVLQREEMAGVNFHKTSIGTCLGVRHPKSKMLEDWRGSFRYQLSVQLFCCKQGWYHQSSVPYRMEVFLYSKI